MVCVLGFAEALVLSPRAPGMLAVSASSSVSMALVTGDMAEVITGDDKGKVGKIINVDKKKGKIVVEGEFSPCSSLLPSSSQYTPSAISTLRIDRNTSKSK